MPSWNAFHGWMAFDALDEDFGLTRAFTIGYRMTDDPADAWTGRFNGFKAKLDGALRGAAVVMGSAVPDLVRGLGLDVSMTVFVPALSSGETVASENSVLWRMTHLCAGIARTRFVGDAISKRAHDPVHRCFDAERRQEILDQAEFRSARISADNILIFDDFITRGATMSHIAQAILASNRGVRIYAVALGKTERRKYWKKFDVDISNDHVPERWERAWG